MKKSLVSAIAMLVVSAIVLTSATFAWFATGDTATVNTISASITNAEGSILISADGNNWKTTLTSEELAAVTTNTITPTLSPVSVNPGSTGIGSIVGGAIEDGLFTASDAAGKYVMFSVLVKSDVDCTVDVTPIFKHQQGYVFAACTVDNAITIVGDTYHPFTGVANDTANDTNGNAIIDTTESNLVAESAIVGEANMNKTITLTAGAPKTLTYYMWAEGQHADCKGQTTDTATLDITFTKAAATTSEVAG